MQHSNSHISIFIKIKINIFGTIVPSEMIKFSKLKLFLGPSLIMIKKKYNAIC